MSRRNKRTSTLNRTARFLLRNFTFKRCRHCWDLASMLRFVFALSLFKGNFCSYVNKTTNLDTKADEIIVGNKLSKAFFEMNILKSARKKIVRKHYWSQAKIKSWSRRMNASREKFWARSFVSTHHGRISRVWTSALMLWKQLASKILARNKGLLCRYDNLSEDKKSA